MMYYIREHNKKEKKVTRSEYLMYQNKAGFMMKSGQVVGFYDIQHDLRGYYETDNRKTGGKYCGST